jgi:hypothetical protein
MGTVIGTKSQMELLKDLAGKLSSDGVWSSIVNILTDEDEWFPDIDSPINCVLDSLEDLHDQVDDTRKKLLAMVDQF